MRRKQVGPEIKLFEFDTLKYLIEDNILDTIQYVALYPERMSPADVTFARKSGLLDSSLNTFLLSKIALNYVLHAITYSEYAFLMLSKQWIKTTNIGCNPIIFNEPLLPFILEEIQSRGRMKKDTFNKEMDLAVLSKYSPLMLSNNESLRYVRVLLIASKLVVVEENEYMINPLASALVNDLISNRSKMVPPSQDEEESYWNSMSHGIFDIVNSTNKNIYSSFYPNLIK